MVITYHGLEFFRLNVGDSVIAFNPISKESKHKSSSFGADIVLSSLNDPDFNGWKNTSRGEKEPFVIKGPGEYEIKEVFIQGHPSFSGYGGKEKANTFYTMIIEDTSICFLGTVNSNGLKEKISNLDEIDILFVPIGGEGVLEPAEAYKLAVSLEPKVIIPMHFGSVGKKDALKTFLKESGGENLKPVDKLALRKKDLSNRKGDVVVLETQGA